MMAIVTAGHLYAVEDDRASQRLAHALAVIDQVKRKWFLPDQMRVAVLYEAGQDGFWISRALTSLGYEVLVVDPASIPVELSRFRLIEASQ